MEILDKVFFRITRLRLLGLCSIYSRSAGITLYWKGARENAQEKLRKVTTLGLASAILYAPQLFIFLTVHIKNRESQVSSMAKSLSGFAVAQISNQGVFPLSLPGALASIATLGIVITLFFSNWRVNLRNRYFIAYALASAVAIITGLAGKFRNLVILTPGQAFWITNAAYFGSS